MKALLFHPGTQYSHKTALQLQRVGCLSEFITGIAFSERDVLIHLIPDVLKSSIANRILDNGIPSNKIKCIPLPELMALYQLRRGQNAEEVFASRNEKFQRKITDRFILNCDGVIGFDTSSWIIAGRAKKIGRPFVLDQSIAHPRAKFELFRSLRQQFPEWREDIPEKSLSLILHEEEEYTLSDRIVVASSFTRESLISNGVSPQKIKLNPYGVSDNFFYKRSTLQRKEKLRFIFLGTLGARKGLPILMDAWMQNSLYLKAELWLAGPASHGVKNMVERTPGMVYKGRVPFNEIPTLLKNCDCLVFPSYFEGFGQVILEAMAAGLPVIATEATAAPDIIENGTDGFIIHSGDPSELARAIQQLIEDPSLCYSMGILAQKKARSFSWDAYGDRWKKILDEI